MPANLPPEYYSAEIRFKEASTPREKVTALEALISTVPKHKGTDKLRADLRRRLSRLREETAKKKKSGKGDLYTVEKQGASQAALIGFSNAGKSSLLGAVTNARPVIADYPMSTVMPLTGMMPFEDIQFQIVDLPPVGSESTDGWCSSIIRNANILMMVIDLSEEPETQADLLLDQLASWNIPLVTLNSPEGEKSDPGNKPLIIAANKSDLPEAGGKMNELHRIYGADFPVAKISSLLKTGLDELRKTVFDNSRIIRVYAKQPGKKPDMDTPFILPGGSHVLALAEIIHKDFFTNFQYACIWGSTRFDGQRVQKDYILRDRDIVEYHAK
jgi:ribosome-interacting GTPase 1